MIEELILKTNIMKINKFLLIYVLYFCSCVKYNSQSLVNTDVDNKLAFSIKTKVKNNNVTVIYSFENKTNYDIIINTSSYFNSFFFNLSLYKLSNGIDTIKICNKRVSPEYEFFYNKNKHYKKIKAGKSLSSTLSIKGCPSKDLKHGFLSLDSGHYLVRGNYNSYKIWEILPSREFKIKNRKSKLMWIGTKRAESKFVVYK